MSCGGGRQLDGLRSDGRLRCRCGCRRAAEEVVLAFAFRPLRGRVEPTDAEACVGSCAELPAAFVQCGTFPFAPGAFKPLPASAPGLRMRFLPQKEHAAAGAAEPAPAATRAATSAARPKSAPAQTGRLWAGQSVVRFISCLHRQSDSTSVAELRSGHCRRAAHKSPHSRPGQPPCKEANTWGRPRKTGAFSFSARWYAADTATATTRSRRPRSRATSRSPMLRRRLPERRRAGRGPC